MREKVTYQDLTVQGIAGTYVIMIGFDMVEADCNHSNEWTKELFPPGLSRS